MADRNTILADVQRDPAFQAAWQEYQTALGKLPASTIAGERSADDSTLEQTTAQRSALGNAFGAKIRQILAAHGADTSDPAYVVTPTGKVAYEPDHALRNILLATGGILVAAYAPALFGGGEVAGAGGAGAGTGAAAGGTAAGVGIGETGATVGLEGSGLAGGGLLAGGAVPAAGVGIGETGATVGLEGSGFGAAGAGATGAGTATGVGEGVASGATTASSDIGPYGPTLDQLGASQKEISGLTGASQAGLGKGFWGQVLGGVATGVGSYLAASKQAGAEKEAAALQAQSAKEALDFLKQRYAQQIRDYAPYGAISQAAAEKGARLLGLQLPSQAAAPGPSNPAIPSGQWNPNEPAGTTHQGGVGQPVDFAGGAGRPDATFGGTSGPLFAGGQAGPVSNSGTVTMVAPDGSVKAVPGALVGFWQARGAKPLGSAV